MLVVVDSLRADMLLKTVEAGDAPTFKRLIERGELVTDCVSSFPSVTPVCTSEITTGVRPDRHLIPGMNWYHRAEQRYVEYGSSFEATRAFGLFRSLYDTVYNLNMGHLNFETPTLFERLADAGLRTACTPFLIYRGRTRHEVGLEGLLKAFANAARFHHAVWGPEELFYGELYSSRKVDCPPTLARPATRDAYSACVARDLVEHDRYDFLLFSLPDNDFYSHRDGPEETEISIALADDAMAELVGAHGGLDAFLADNAVIVVADHAQSFVEHRLELQAAPRRALGGAAAERGADRRRPARGRAERARRRDLAAPRRRRRAGPARRRGLCPPRTRRDGIDLLAWLTPEGEPTNRWAAVSGSGIELRFRPGEQVRDARGRGWELDGDPAALSARIDAGRFLSDDYPDALGRLWAALANPNAGDILVSLAPGWECADWGGADHIPGGSHGSLLATDSLGALLTVGLDGKRPERLQWAISDVYDLIVGHFGIDD